MDNNPEVKGDAIVANTLNDLRSKVEEQVNTIKDNIGLDLYDKIKIGVVVVITTLIILGILYYVYKKIKEKYLEPNKYYLLENITSSSPNIVPDCEVVKPHDGYNFSVHIKMFIENYYSNYGTWRHVFHKGTQLDDLDILDYPFNDSVNLLFKRGCFSIVQPKGSINDKNMISFTNKNKMSLYFTTERFFKH